MTKHFFLAVTILYAVSATARNPVYKTTIVPLGECLVENTDIIATFRSETVTMDQQPYSKSMLVTFVTPEGQPIANPDDRSVTSSIPASDEVKVKEKKNVIQIVYKASRNDNGLFVVNTATGEGSLKRYLALKGSMFTKKEVVQDISLNMRNCMLDVEGLAGAVTPVE